MMYNLILYLFIFVCNNYIFVSYVQISENKIFKIMKYLYFVRKII